MHKPIFYIRDCHGNITGNPKGYKSHKSAETALSRRYKSWKLLRYYLWHIYDEMHATGSTSNLIYTIKLSTAGTP